MAHPIVTESSGDAPGTEECGVDASRVNERTGAQPVARPVISMSGGAARQIIFHQNCSSAAVKDHYSFVSYSSSSSYSRIERDCRSTFDLKSSIEDDGSPHGCIIQLIPYEYHSNCSVRECH